MSTLPDLSHALVYARICDLRTEAAGRRTPVRPAPARRLLPALRRGGATYLRWMEHGHLGLIPPAVDPCSR
jgi:hypothetical protein